MLLRLHARCECGGTVPRQHGHHRLRKNGPVVKLNRDLVHGGAHKLATGIDGALVRIEPRKSRQQ